MSSTKKEDILARLRFLREAKITVHQWDYAIDRY